MHSITPPPSNADLAVFQTKDIQERASSLYRTHSNPLLAKIYRVASVLSTPVKKAAYWQLVGARQSIGKGSRRGAGGVPKKYSTLKAIGWLGVGIVFLPLVLLGLGLELGFKPGRGKDVLRFFDATKGGAVSYIPPKLSETEEIHLATFNAAGLQPLVDAIKDVRPTSERMVELVEWINGQKEEDLPLGLGLQEMFDEKGSEIVTNGIKARYPYAVTSAGLSKIPFLGSNSGLEFHSRVPIKSAAFYGFQDLDGFGVKCSDRGFLRVELDLGEGKSALVYVTHTQPHADPKHQKIRQAELELIQHQMRYDRYQDTINKVDRGGHYYLMGDCNVANVDDEHAQEEGGGLINEYNRLRQEGQVFHSDSFFDPFLEEHSPDGSRIKGKPRFLDADVDNATREQLALRERKWKVITEPRGSFYRGADQKNRLLEGYGTKNFYKGSHPVVDNCRFDYVLQLRHPEDFKDPTTVPHFTGIAEIRHVLPKGEKTTAVSDHLLVSAIFKKSE